MTELAATQEAVAIYNDAMDELGVSRIDSFEERSPTAAKAKPRFDRIAKNLLALFPWTFDTRRVQLTQLQNPPVSGYDYVYDISTLGRVVAVYDWPDSDRPVRGHRVMSGTLHSNCDELWADVRSLEPEDTILNWPPLFRSALVKALAADACMKAGRARTLRADLIVEAQGDQSTYPTGGLIGLAAQEDGQQHGGGQLVLADGPLVEARR